MDGLADLRQMRAARLLAGVEGYSPPSLQALVRGAFEAVFAARGDERNDFCDAQLGGFFDDPLEAIEFDQGRAEHQSRFRSGAAKLFNGPEHHAVFAGGFDLGEKHVAIVGNFVTLARFYAQHTCQVARVVARNLGVPVSYLVHEKPSSHSDFGLLTSVFFSLMIAHLRGTLLEKHPNLAILDVHGVGYEVTIPVSAFSSLPEKGQPVALHIHTHVREDALALFGFLTAADKALFEKLISVSGIGPKLAITALSGLQSGDLIAAIRSGAVEQLVRIPGVGKKTAERMVLELRDKLDPAGVPERGAGAAPQSNFNAIEEDVISALMNFGANRASAEAAVNKARARVESGSESNDFDPLFRRALKLVR